MKANNTLDTIKDPMINLLLVIPSAAFVDGGGGGELVVVVGVLGDPEGDVAGVVGVLGVVLAATTLMASFMPEPQ